MTIDDSTLADSIKLHLRWDSRVQAENITVAVENRHVTLSGSVPNYLDLWVAVEDVRNLPGVRSVIQQLVVKPPAQTSLPEDAAIKLNIYQALKHQSVVDTSNIKVGVKAGHVEIDGSVESFWHKAIVEGYAISTVGVVQISNRLAVVPHESASDEETARDIIGAFRRSVMIDALAIDVKVEHGAVTLSGNVPNADAYRAAESAAAYTFGVVNVDNQLIID